VALPGGARVASDGWVHGRGAAAAAATARRVTTPTAAHKPPATSKTTTRPTVKPVTRAKAKAKAKPAHAQPRPATVLDLGHYVRSLRGNAHDLAIMRTLGARDAQKNTSHGQHLVLLDIGGQVAGGVYLSTTHRFITYPKLTRALEAYVDGYHQRQHANAPVTIAIGTNNDLLVSAARGRIWADDVVDPVLNYADHYPQITIAGADDIEPGFSAGPAATRAWLNAFLASTSAPFVFNGSADGCSWRASHSHCAGGWTSNDLVQLAAFAAPQRTIVLPQVYNDEMAGQWGMLAAAARHAHQPMHIVGPLTENRACGRDPYCPTMPSRGARTHLWASLHYTRAGISALPVQVDLDVS
jgi:hypothetical protein